MNDPEVIFCERCEGSIPNGEVRPGEEPVCSDCRHIWEKVLSFLLSPYQVALVASLLILVGLAVGFLRAGSKEKSNPGGVDRDENTSAPIASALADEEPRLGLPSTSAVSASSVATIESDPIPEEVSDTSKVPQDPILSEDFVEPSFESDELPNSTEEGSGEELVSAAVDVSKKEAEEEGEVAPELDADEVVRVELTLSRQRNKATRDLRNEIWIRAEEALSEYDEKLENNPRSYELLLGRAVALIALSRFGDSVETLDEALALDSERPEAWHWKASARLFGGDIEGAYKDAGRAVECDPLYASGHITKGMCLLKKERMGESIEMLERGVALDPDDFMGQTLLADTARNEGRLELAMRACNEAFRIAPETEDIARMRRALFSTMHSPFIESEADSDLVFRGLGTVDGAWEGGLQSAVFCISPDGSRIGGFISYPRGTSQMSFGTIHDGAVWNVGGSRVPGFGGDVSAIAALSLRGEVALGQMGASWFTKSKAYMMRSDGRDAVPLSRDFSNAYLTGSDGKRYALDLAGTLATGIAADGRAAAVTGSFVVALNSLQLPLKWTTEGFEFLELAPGRREGRATGISLDGSVVVGSSADRACVWRDRSSVELLGELERDGKSWATAISPGGEVVVGTALLNEDLVPFRWTEETGMQLLVEMPDNVASINPASVSMGGRVVVGQYTDRSKVTSAFVWNKTEGFRSVEGFLRDEGIRFTQKSTGWRLTNALRVSVDGSVIVGNAIAGSKSRAWLVSGYARED